MELSDIARTLEGFLASDSDHLWLVDKRIFWEGKEEEFQEYFGNNTADLLATEVRDRADDPGWTWWSHLVTGNTGKSAVSGVAALLPLVRFSRDAAGAVIHGIRNGWNGHPEAVIPTLVNHAGLKIEDIGGEGSYTPAERAGVWYDHRTWHWQGPVEYVPGKLHFPMASRYNTRLPDQLSEDPRVAFLFLTRGDIHHPGIWKEYLEQAGQRARIHAHTKEPGLLAEDSLIRGRQIPTRVATAWGELSLVHATLALLRHALEDSATTHFVLVSESCVPVTSFARFRANLRRDDRSRIRVWSLDEIRRGGNLDKVGRLEQLEEIPKEHAYFQDQWMCLSREDALIVTEKDWTPCFKNVYAADECYFATVLDAVGKSPRDLLPNRPITWTDWRGGAHPREFHRVPPQVAARIAESGCFFARKFPAGSDIGKWGLHLEDTLSPAT